MNKQFHILINDQDPIIIDVIDDKSFYIRISQPPMMFYEGSDSEPEANIKISGSRWTSGHYQLEWLHQHLKTNDKITIQILESDQKPSPLIKDEKFEAPEESCSFCNKKKSEVKLLIKRNDIIYICNECVTACQEVINQHDAS